ncbi:SOD2 [Symbiodinium sp. KB8]|nr:SOD2 [Symbiodinium sp. KB8]
MALATALNRLAVTSGRAATPAVSALSTGAGFTLPDLPYGPGELEPYVSGAIMELHHGKHHATYVNNLNAALDKYASAEKAGDVAEMIALQGAIKFNGGGHVNHSIFWTNLAPPNKGGGGEPTGKVGELIQQQWGSFEAFKKDFNARTAAVQGSGWGWLGLNKESGKLAIATCANQDPLSTTGLVPLLGIDVWEHAYYLQYKNVRPDYLNAIWNVVNWGNVEERMGAAQ